MCGLGFIGLGFGLRVLGLGPVNGGLDFSRVFFQAWHVVFGLDL